jgi:hypothetical protein
MNDSHEFGVPETKIARALSVVEARERERLSQESYDQIFGPFDRGELHELTDQEWQDLMDGKRKSPHNPQSFALPPCS